jgi:hypothetical protein
MNGGATGALKKRNIRELNDENKHRAVRAMIGESSCIVFCLQQIKMQNINSSFTKKIAPKRFNKFPFNCPLTCSTKRRSHLWLKFSHLSQAFT